jgi:pantothenate kinase
MDGTAFAFRERMNGNHRIIICRFGDPETVHIHPPIGYYVVAYEWMTLFIVQIRTKSIVSPRIKSEKTVKQSLDPFLVVSCWSGYKIISGSTFSCNCRWGDCLSVFGCQLQMLALLCSKARSTCGVQPVQ